jgi:hypothetical protein
LSSQSQTSNQNIEHIETENKMPELPKFINPNSYVQNLERISNILGINYINNKNEYIKKFDEEVFDATLIGLYFSSGWGSPCRIFSKYLINLYNEINEGEKVLEIIQISFENDEQDFKRSISNLPWKFLPFNDPKIKELQNKYNVLEIPKFIPIDRNGEKMSDYGREDLYEYGIDIIEKWNEDIRIVSQDEVERLLDERKHLYLQMKAQYEENLE